MAELDIKAKAYFSNSERFADAFNFFIYEGEQVIRADELKPMDTAAIALPYGLNAETPIEKFRDLLKLYAAMRDGKAIYLALGLEVQRHVHYAMPVRGYLYDALNYADQVAKAAASYRKNKVYGSDAEFLSGFRKEDRLMPIITLTISLSADAWDGPTSLHEMMAIEDKRLLKYVQNYKLNLLTPAQIAEEDFGKFQTSLGTFMQFAKHKNDKDMLWMAGNKRFQNIDRETVGLIKAVTGLKIDIEEKEGEVINMWPAWENGLKQAKQDGINQGINIGKVASVLRMAEKFKISIKDAMDAVGISQAEWDAARAEMDQQAANTQ